MEQKTVWLESAVAGVLRLDGHYAGVVERKPVRAETCANALVVEFQPLDSERYRPFCCRLRFRPACGCPRASLVVWGGARFTVRLNPERRRRARPLAALAQAEYGDTLYTVCDDGSAYLLAEAGKDSVILPIDAELNSAELAILSEPAPLLELRGNAGAETYYGLYRLEDAVPAFEGMGDRFELTQDALFMEKACADMAGSRLRTEFRYEDGAMEFAGQSTLSYRTGFERALPARLVPYAFLEGVQQKSETAELFLTAEMAEEFTPDAAADFFGEFTDIAACPEETEPYAAALLYPGERDCLLPKRYAFELEGKRIANIKILD